MKYEILTLTEYREKCSDHFYDKFWKDLGIVSLSGIYRNGIDSEENEHGTEFFGRLFDIKKPNEGNWGVAIGSSIKDIVPNPETLFGKKVIISGLTSRSYSGLYNLFTITKVEVLGANDKVVETFNSNKKSKAALREYFERMDIPIPKEFAK